MAINPQDVFPQALYNIYDARYGQLSSVIALMEGQQAGVIAFETKALMDADLAHVAGTAAMVTNDSTPANNTYYRKTGASGAGSWVKSAWPFQIVHYVSDYVSLNAAITALNATGNKEILLLNSPSTLTASVSVDPEVHITASKNGLVTLNSGQTLTFSTGATFEAGMYQVFTGPGAVVGLSISRPQWFGSTNAVLNTTAVQNAINALAVKGILFFDDIQFTFENVNIRTVGVKVVGNGVVDGSLTIQAGTTGIAGNHLDMFVDVLGVKFHNVSARSDAAAITLVNARRGNIWNNKFFGFKDAILVPVNTDPTAWGGHVARWIISHNTYGFSADESTDSPNVDYFCRFLDSYSHGASLSTADMTITNNEGTANISHIDIDSIDGLTEHDNTFTFPAGESSVKAQSVKITYGVWLHIHDEKLWESGLEGLLLTQCARYNAHDLMIAWPGVRLESTGIKVTGIPLAGAYYGQGVIHHNKIIEPTGHGIDIGAKEGRTAVDNNYIWKPGSTDRYYGVPALSGTQKLIITDADTIGLKVHDNDGTYKPYSLVSGGTYVNVNENNTFDLVGDGGAIQYHNEPHVYEMTTGYTLDVTRLDQVNFNHAGATDFTQFTHTIGTGKIKNLICRFYNGNTTLVHGANLILKGSINVTPTTYQVITFQIVDDIAIELNRNF